MTSAVAVAGPRRALAVAVRFAGAALLGATAVIHVRLYLEGYRDIPTIGSLFLLNVLAAAVAALVLLVAPRGWLVWAALAGGLLEAGTLGALILSLTVGLFGFSETPRAPLVAPTIAVESTGAVLLLGFAALSVVRDRRPRS